MDNSLQPKKRLLFLSQTLPFPPNNGVTIRSYNTMRLLSREYAITALCFYRRRSRGTSEEVQTSIQALRAFGSVEAYPIEQEHSRTRYVSDHLASVATGRPYTYYTYVSRSFEQRMRELLQTGAFDFVHLESLDLSAYLEFLGGQRVVVVHHNVESLLLERRAAAEPSFLRSAYIRLQAQLTRREERKWCARVALNVVVSDNDAEALRTIAPQARITVLPNGVDTHNLQPAPATVPEAPHRVVFVGAHHWFPNADALSFFCEDVLPFLRELNPLVEIHWVGKMAEADRLGIQRRHDITAPGFVADIRPEVWPAACFVVPLRVGGGTRLKILDAWAMGKAVVSTTVGCEGLAAQHGRNILIADDARAFAQAVHRVLVDRELRQTLETNARRTAEELYDWEVIGRSMYAEYDRIIRSDPLPG